MLESYNFKDLPTYLYFGIFFLYASFSQFGRTSNRGFSVQAVLACVRCVLNTAFYVNQDQLMVAFGYQPLVTNIQVAA